MTYKQSAAIFLAAGNQTRFKADHLKCMSDIGGKPLLAHTADLWHPDWDLYLVTGDLWGGSDIGKAAGMGFNIVPAEGPSIGDSIASGILAIEGREYSEVAIVSADTFFARAIPYTAEKEVVFDPWAWINIWYLRKTENRLRSQIYRGIKDRLIYVALSGMPVLLSKYKWWKNINTVEDLEQARLLHGAAQPSL